jgi:2-alkyl-3-oxoalkanoate reductase
VRVLVTGASGMLGRSTAQVLMSRGDEVTVLQRRPSGLACREVLGDITDAQAVERAVNSQEAVLHLAAKVDVSGRWADYERINIDGTSNVVDACRSGRVSRLVHVSSPSVAHGGAPLVGVGAAPADPAGARGNYSRSKAIAELCALSADSDELRVLVIRPHLVWGPGDTQLVKPVVDRARQRRLPIVAGGAALIDTTYVDNAAAALVAALDACGPVHGEALVVSNGEPRPIKEILLRLCAAAGVRGPTISVPFAVAWLAGGVADAASAITRQRIRPALTRFTAEQMATAHWFDQRRSRDALNWSPHVSLDDGFARLAEWFGAGVG